MDLSIKGFYTLVFIAIFFLMMVGLLVMNINHHHATKVTLSVVNEIQKANGITASVEGKIEELENKYSLNIELLKVEVAKGYKYQVTVSFKSTVGIIGVTKTFKKSKLTQVIQE